jgi:hypothetical protein
MGTAFWVSVSVQNVAGYPKIRAIIGVTVQVMDRYLIHYPTIWQFQRR